jgi:hypothetical protein
LHWVRFAGTCADIKRQQAGDSEDPSSLYKSLINLELNNKGINKLSMTGRIWLGKQFENLDFSEIQL